MDKWTSGYVSEINYTYGYYSEMNPLLMKLIFLKKGIIFPEVGTACELGYGQGLSTNIHAAASVTQWYGTDFNPSQAGFAQEISSTYSSSAKLYDESFAEFCNRNDLPDFDFITLHGIWSWISDENRKVITKFIRKKLKVGGVLYISYNTLPGWAPFVPLRHLMKQHAVVNGTIGKGITANIEEALKFTESLLSTNTKYSQNNPNLEKRFDKVKQHNRNYLAHEYFNLDWCPMHFSTLAEWMEDTKLHYACSANYHESIDSINLTVEQQEFLNKIPDQLFKETTRDFIVNQQFRKDYWIKGKRTLTIIEQIGLLKLQKIILIKPVEEINLKIDSLVGEIELNEKIYGSILEAIADYKIKTIHQVEYLIKKNEINFAQLIEAVIILVGAGHIGIANDEETISKSKKQTDKLNKFLCKKAQINTNINYLASPVLGGGYEVTRLEQLFINAIMNDLKKPSEWVQATWEILQKQGQKLQKQGKTINTDEENIAELNLQAKIFNDKKLSLIKALQII